MDAYAYWRTCLKNGGTAPEGTTFLPTYHGNGTHEEPQPGIYRVRVTKGGPLVPVQIWLRADDGAVMNRFEDGCSLAGTIDGKPADADTLADRWIWCKAVSKSDHEHYKTNGVWPGEVETAGKAAGIGDNSRDLSLAAQIRDYAETALSWLRKAGGIKDKLSSDMAANYRAELLRLAKDADKQRETEKRPHDDAAKAVQAKWKPIIDDATFAANTIRDELTKWMRAEEARQEAARRAKFEAEQRAVAIARAEADAQRAKQMRDDPIAALTSPPPEVPEMPTAPEPVKVNAGGQRGRAAGLRTVTRYVVTDHAAALAFFAESGDVRDLIQKLAERASKAGVNVPGVEKQIEKVAA